MISVHFQGKAFSITVIQVYAATTDAKEIEVDLFYEDLQHLLELTPEKDVLFIIGDWNAKIGSQEILERAVLRWQRNRTGRPLSPSQIHQKNISMLSKLHKTTSEYWQRTSGTQKSRSLSSKTGRKNIKDKKETKEVGRELHPEKELRSRKGVLKRDKFPNTRKHSYCQVCGEPWKHRGQHNREEK